MEFCLNAPCGLAITPITSRKIIVRDSRCSIDLLLLVLFIYTILVFSYSWLLDVLGHVLVETTTNLVNSNPIHPILHPIHHHCHIF